MLVDDFEKSPHLGLFKLQLALNFCKSFLVFDSSIENRDDFDHHLLHEVSTVLVFEICKL